MPMARKLLMDWMVLLPMVAQCVLRSLNPVKKDLTQVVALTGPVVLSAIATVVAAVTVGNLIQLFQQ
jgi:hypothetical protein